MLKKKVQSPTTAPPAPADEEKKKAPKKRRVNNLPEDSRKCAFSRIPYEFLMLGKYCPEIPRAALLVFYILCAHYNTEDKECYPRNDTIMREAGFKDDHTLFEAIRVLKAYELIERVREHYNLPNGVKGKKRRAFYKLPSYQKYLATINKHCQEKAEKDALGDSRNDEEK